MYSSPAQGFIDNAGYNLSLMFEDYAEFQAHVKDIRAVCQEFNWNFSEVMGSVRIRMAFYLKQKKK